MASAAAVIGGGDPERGRPVRTIYAYFTGNFLSASCSRRLLPNARNSNREWGVYGDILYHHGPVRAPRLQPRRMVEASG